MDEEIKILFVDFVGFEKTVKVMSYAKGISKTVNNPFFNAISNLDERIEPAKVRKIKEYKGFGIIGEVEKDKIIIGNEKVMNEQKITLQGDTSNKIFLAINGQVQAAFRFNKI